jgi:glycosyltransferase involved in cell wall biosynthesis
MKIGFLCQPFDNFSPRDPGGSIGLLTWELARRLARSCEVVVYASRSPEQASRERWEGVEFKRVRLTPDYWLLDRPRRVYGPLNQSRSDVHSFLYYTIYALRLAKRLRLDGCDVIHIHNFSQFVPVARLLNRRAKILLHMNCEWLTQFDHAMINRRLRHADAIIGCADYITDRVRARFPHYADRCVTLYNGADVDQFSPGPGQPSAQGGGKRFLFVGRVSPEKGLHVLVDAFKSVIAREPDAQLKIVGGPHIPPLSFIVEQSDDSTVRGLRRFYNTNYLEYLRNLVRTALLDQVSFVGPVPHNQLSTVLREADIFVQPSVWGEPFPLSVIEAMAAGLAVVASRAGGLPESVVDGKTGVLVEPNNPAALADAMLQLVSDKQKLRSMGAAGGARARELFSWETVVARLSSIYNALVSRSPIASLSVTAA